MITRFAILALPILLATACSPAAGGPPAYVLDYKATLPLSHADSTCTKLVDNDVIRIHVTLDELTGDDDCSDCIGIGRAKAVMPPAVEDDDDDGHGDSGGTFAPAPHATDITYNNTDGEFPSPFDFNLDKKYASGSKHATLVEVLLDDPGLSFITTGDPGAIIPNTDAKFTILTTAAAKKAGLFDCVHALTRDPKIKGPYLNKLRFHINSGLPTQAAGVPISGGLNIGVLVNTSNTNHAGQKIYIPLYIDPHPQNGG